MRKLLLLIIMCLLLTELCIANVSASGKTSYKTEIEDMLKKMEKFEYSILYELDVKDIKMGTAKSIKLDKNRMSRAAALTLDYSYDDVVYNYVDGPEWEYKYKVDNKELKKAGKNLFGRNLKTSYVTSKINCRYIDVFKDAEYGVVYRSESSSYKEKGDYYVYSTTVKKKGKKYSVVKKCYFGYYGGAATGESNYTITYSLSNSTKSEYGYIINGIKIKKTAKTFTEEDMKYLATSDEDGDLLPALYEMAYGTDPLNADTDGDGIGDYIEIVNGLDPLDPYDKDSFMGYNDIDGDGLSDYDEIIRYNSDPINPDTDADGLKDGFEIINNFDPLNNDTDGNGVLDGKEEFEQTYMYETSSEGWMYEDLLKNAGNTMEVFGEDLVIREDIGALKRVFIKASVAGDIERIFDIESMYGVHVILTTSPYIVGIPIEISISKDYLKSSFKSAEVIFEYDEDWLLDGEEDLLIPAFCDDDFLWPQSIDNYKIDKDKNTITFTINKPGYYYIVAL